MPSITAVAFSLATAETLGSKTDGMILTRLHLHAIERPATNLERPLGVIVA